jgi:non-ribosomal peptide synthetase component F
MAVKTKLYEWSFSELNEKANQVAKTIVRLSPLDTEARIALLFEHDAPMIAGILGVLKTGKSYVPLDPSYPTERLVYILEDSQATAVLTNNNNLSIADKLTQNICPIINIDEVDSGHFEDIKVSISPDTVAYILYTSGSTGKPKGVIQNHRNVLHFIRCYTNNLHINADDKLTLLSSYSFDAAIVDIFAALLNGATVYHINLREEGLIELSKWLIEQQITIYHSTPTVYRYFLRELTNEETFPSIRFVVLGGEPVYQEDVELYKKHFVEPGIFVNLLGATESTLAFLYLMNKQTSIGQNTVPVGYPIENGCFIA